MQFHAKNTTLFVSSGLVCSMVFPQVHCGHICLAVKILVWLGMIWPYRVYLMWIPWLSVKCVRHAREAATTWAVPQLNLPMGETKRPTNQTVICLLVSSNHKCGAKNSQFYTRRIKAQSRQDSPDRKRIRICSADGCCRFSDNRRKKEHHCDLPRYLRCCKCRNAGVMGACLCVLFLHHPSSPDTRFWLPYYWAECFHGNRSSLGEAAAWSCVRST